MKKDNNSDLITDLMTQAESGEVDAQYKLGLLYRTQEHLHYKEAFRWLQKAAEQGYAEAQNAAGEMLKVGKKIGQNLKEAVRWFALSAEQGNATACYNLAEAYLYKGMGPNDQAFYWYQKAVDLGKWEALFQLGVMHLEGIGTPVDEEKAEECFCKLVEYDDGAYPFIINEYRSERQNDKVFEWIEKAADHGIDSAQYELGKAYEKGISCRRNIPKAIAWYQKAAVAGNEDAQEALKRLNDKECILKAQEEYFLNLVEEKETELIGKPSWEECKLVYSYDNRAGITYIYHEDCALPVFCEYAMFHLLMSYAGCLIDDNKDWIEYAARAVNYLRKLPAKTRSKELGFYYTRVADWYEESGDNRRAAWHQKRAVIYRLNSVDWALDDIQALVADMTEEEVSDFCLYVLQHITEQGCFGEDDFYADWKRKHYELVEYVLHTAMERFVLNENTTVSLCSFILFLNAVYLKRTRRFTLAETIFKKSLSIPETEGDERYIIPDVVYTLLGECYLHGRPKARADDYFQKIEDKASLVWEYVQSSCANKVVADELNQACHEAVIVYCCQENILQTDLKDAIDTFFAPPEIYDEEEYSDEAYEDSLEE